MFNFEARVLIGWLVNALASQPITTRASKLKIFFYVKADGDYRFGYLLYRNNTPPCETELLNDIALIKVTNLGSSYKTTPKLQATSLT